MTRPHQMLAIFLGTGFSHLAVRIDKLKAAVEAFPWSKQRPQTPRQGIA